MDSVPADVLQGDSSRVDCTAGISFEQFCDRNPPASKLDVSRTDFFSLNPVGTEKCFSSLLIEALVSSLLSRPT